MNRPNIFLKYIAFNRRHPIYFSLLYIYLYFLRPYQYYRQPAYNLMYSPLKVLLGTYIH